MECDDGLPPEAFTADERAAGVPGILSGRGDRAHRDPERTSKTTEADCIELIIRQLVMRDVNLEVVSPEDDDGVGPDFTDVARAARRSIEQAQVSLLADGHRITVRVLRNALRTTGIPLFADTPGPWLVWEEASQSLVTNIAYRGGYLKRGFWQGGSRQELRVPAEPARARVFKVMRAAYVSGDHGMRPLLVHRSHLADALNKKAVPFEAPAAIPQEQAADFSLVYFTSAGEVASVPLAAAWEEKVSVATRTGSYFHATQWGGDLRCSLNDTVLRVNGIRMCADENLGTFQYYLRRNTATVFQSAFQPADLPSGMGFWYSRPDDVESRASRMSEWAAGRNAKVYITTHGHPLQSNDCDYVTTPEHYARAIRMLHERGFRMGDYSSSPRPLVIWVPGNVLASSTEGPYAERWQPSSSE